MSRALSFNLVGGLVGVGLEYLSMVYGIRALTYIAIVIYLAVLFLTSHAAGRNAPGNGN